MNTSSPSTTRILCFGDSNTWGYIPASAHQRYPANQRWTGVLQQVLGNTYEIIEEGLNSRTFCTEDPRPEKPGRHGLNYLIPCLDTHDPLDMVIIMLGSNELKEGYALQATDIASMLEHTIHTLTHHYSQSDRQAPTVLIASPPLVDTEAVHCRSEYAYHGAREKSQALAPLYQQIAEAHHCVFADAALFTSVGADGIHMTPESHTTLGHALAELIATQP